MIKENLALLLSYVRGALKSILRPSVFNWNSFKKASFLKRAGRLVYTFFLLLITFILALELNFLWLFGDMPGMKEVRNPKLAVPSKVISFDGVEIGAFTIENRKPVAFEAINKFTIDALIATEDVRFYEHNGVDFRALGGVFIGLFSQGGRGGGSTITQQLAKNMFKTRGKQSAGLLNHIPLVKTFIIKFKEWLTAFKLSYFFEKNEVLTLYLNAVDFGDNSYGIQQASEHFFSKNPIDLEIQEAAVLIGSLKATTTYNPIKKPEASLKRRNVVLEQMMKYEKISQEQYDVAIVTPLELSVTPFKIYNEMAPYFMQALKVQLEDWCQENGYNLYTDGLVILTTLDTRAQGYAEKAVKEHLAAHQKSLVQEQRPYKYWFDKKIAEEKATFKKENPTIKTIPTTPTEELLQKKVEKSPAWQALISSGKTEEQALEIFATPKKVKLFFHDGIRELTASSLDSVKHMAQVLHAGMVSVEPSTGYIKAWVGGVDYKTFQFDHVNQASRQPGSAFKPIIYAAALEQGYEPCTTIVDQPISLRTSIAGKDADWKPKNASGTHTYAPMLLRKALGQSVNSIAIQILQDIKPTTLQAFAKRLGIQSAIDNNLSIALGTSNVKLLELVQPYATFTNAGISLEPVLLSKITSLESDVLYEYKAEGKQVTTPEIAYNMTHYLMGSVEEAGGTSRRLYNYNLPYQNQIGGKTGTTNDYVDAWYLGVTQPLVTGVWVGCEDSRIHFTSANGQGGRSALPIFGKYMQDIYNDKSLGIKKGKFQKPLSYQEKLPDCFNRVIIPADTLTLKTDSLATDSLKTVENVLDSIAIE